MKHSCEAERVQINEQKGTVSAEGIEESIKRIDEEMAKVSMHLKRIYVITLILAAYGAGSFYSERMQKALNEGRQYLAMAPETKLKFPQFLLNMQHEQESLCSTGERFWEALCPISLKEAGFCAHTVPVDPAHGHTAEPDDKQGLAATQLNLIRLKFEHDTQKG